LATLALDDVIVGEPNAVRGKKPDDYGISSDDYLTITGIPFVGRGPNVGGSQTEDFSEISEDCRKIMGHRD